MNKNILKVKLFIKNHYYVAYTVVFAIMAMLVTSWFFLVGRTLIWQEDGWSQHYNALVYYAKYLRTIIRNVIEQHQFILPEWDFNIGEGGDILETLHYYVIGDPFAFFSVLVPTKYMYYYYNFMMLFRVYLAGIAFSALCFETGLKSRYGILAGSMSYVFCYWALINIARHPYFLNPMIYLPMLLIGVEKLIKNKRPYFFVISVFLAAISNFYFFYILVLLTVIYVAVRLVLLYKKDIKSIIVSLFKIACSSVGGCC